MLEKKYWHFIVVFRKIKVKCTQNYTKCCITYSMALVDLASYLKSGHFDHSDN